MFERCCSIRTNMARYGGCEFYLFVVNFFVVCNGKHTYHADPKTWEDALKFCQEKNGILATNVTKILATSLSDDQIWTGQYIGDRFQSITIKGCYDKPKEINGKTVPIIHGDFEECLSGCSGSKHIGLEKRTCFCLTEEAMQTTKRNKYSCDFARKRFCDLSNTDFIGCGGESRLSVYTIEDNDFLLPEDFNRTHRILCAKLGSGSISLADCDTILTTVCEKGSGKFKAPDPPLEVQNNWLDAVQTCTAERNQLPTSTDSSDDISEDVWYGGFGMRLTEKVTDVLPKVQFPSSLCGSVDKEESINFVPCTRRLPFVCVMNRQPDQQQMPYTVLVIGLVVGVFVLAALISVITICTKRRVTKKPKRNENSEQIITKDVEYEYSTIDETNIKTPGSGDMDVGNYEEISTTDKQNVEENGTCVKIRTDKGVKDDTYDSMMRFKGNKCSGNYDHVKCQGNIKDNYDDMTSMTITKVTNDVSDYDNAKCVIQKNERGDNYDKIDITSEDKCSENYDHVISHDSEKDSEDEIYENSRS